MTNGTGVRIWRRWSAAATLALQFALVGILPVGEIFHDHDLHVTPDVEWDTGDEHDHGHEPGEEHGADCPFFHCCAAVGLPLEAHEAPAAAAHRVCDAAPVRFLPYGTVSVFGLSARAPPAA